MENLCRVCSSPGEYNVFAVIPPYLHARAQDYSCWRKPIDQLLEETTGLVVRQDDGLPQKMCALCISYLKHAATFRQQAIDNILNLKAANVLEDPLSSSKDKDLFLTSTSDLIFSDKRKTDTNQVLNNHKSSGNIQNNEDKKSDEYFKKFLILNENGKRSRSSGYKNNVNSQRKQNNIPAEVELLIGSSDENDGDAGENKNFFNYEEKNFEEDDVMDIEEMKNGNVTVNIPEYFKERKCRACSRRFMFDESYKEHLELCIEYRFVVLIEEINRLLDIRRSKSISPHEFIRRMIFSLKKMCQWLKNSCGDNILTFIEGNSSKKERLQSEEKSSDLSSGENCITILEKKPAPKEETSLMQLLQKSADADPTLIRFFNNTPESDPLLNLLKSSSSEKSFRTSTPQTQEIDLLSSNFKASCLDDDEQRISSAVNILNKKHSGVGCFQRIPTSSEEEEKVKNNESKKQSCVKNLFSNKKASKQASKGIIKAPIFQKHQVLPVSTTEPCAPSHPKMVFSAKCNQCNTPFDSIGSLEQHNAKFHNKPVAYDKYKKIIALFEADDDEEEDEFGQNDLFKNGKSISSKLDGIVDLI